MDLGDVFLDELLTNFQSNKDEKLPSSSSRIGGWWCLKIRVYLGCGLKTHQLLKPILES